MKKILIIAVVMLVGLFTISNVNAANNLGTVQAFKNTNDEVEVQNSSAEEVVVTFKKIELTWSEAKPEIGRNSAGWWVGFKITAPTDKQTQEALKKATYYRKGLEKPMPLWNSMDANEQAGHYFGAWKGIDETDLKGKTEVFELGRWQFDWDGNGQTDQTVIIKIDPSEGNGITFKEPDPEKYVTINVGDKMIFTIEKNATLNTLTKEEKELLNEILTPAEGYKFVGLYMVVDGEEVLVDLENTKFSANTKLTVKFEEVSKNQEEATTSQESVDNPNTYDNILGYVALVFIALSSVAVIFKKILKTN